MLNGYDYFVVYWPAIAKKKIKKIKGKNKRISVLQYHETFVLAKIKGTSTFYEKI